METREESGDGPEDLAKRRALAKYARTITGMSVVALTAAEAIGAANAYQEASGGFGGRDSGYGRGGTWGSSSRSGW